MQNFHNWPRSIWQRFSQGLYHSFDRLSASRFEGPVHDPQACVTCRRRQEENAADLVFSQLPLTAQPERLAGLAAVQRYAVEVSSTPTLQWPKFEVTVIRGWRQASLAAKLRQDPAQPQYGLWADPVLIAEEVAILNRQAASYHHVHFYFESLVEWEHLGPVLLDSPSWQWFILPLVIVEESWVARLIEGRPQVFILILKRPLPVLVQFLEQQRYRCSWAALEQAGFTIRTSHDAQFKDQIFWGFG